MQSNDSLDNVAATVEEIPKYKVGGEQDKLSYTSRLDMGVAGTIWDQIQTNLPKLMKMLYDCNIFQEPYTMSEVSSIFQDFFLCETRGSSK